MESLRKLELSDLEEMVNLRIGIQNYDARFLDEKAIVLSEDELREKSREYLTKSLNDNLYMFGYFVDNKLVANCGFYVDRHFPTYTTPNGITGYMCNVFTLEEYRGRGYQRKIFEEALKYAKSMDITNFKLSSINDKAIRMYKSFGFTFNDHMYSYKVEK